MSGVTHSPEEVGCPRRCCSFGFRNDIVITQFIQRPATVPHVANPKRGLKIADAAGTLFYVWFLEAYRSPKSRIPHRPCTQNGSNVSLGTLATILLQRL